MNRFAQSARVALAKLLYDAGNGAAAAEVGETAVRREGEEVNDPWTDYRLAYPGVGRLVLDELRAIVQGFGSERSPSYSIAFER